MKRSCLPRSWNRIRTPPAGVLVTVFSCQEKVSQIVPIDPMGMQARKITDTAVRKQRAEFSPDGKSLLYNVIEVGGQSVSGSIHVIGIDDGGDRALFQ